jgi:hypothetical protein
MPYRCSCYVLFAATAALFSNLGANADDAKPAPSEPTSSCDSGEYRQFDFWVGRWSVTEGERPDAKTNTSVRHRITWTPQRDGSVLRACPLRRQHLSLTYGAS